jgi:hypothetical protein
MPINALICCRLLHRLRVQPQVHSLYSHSAIIDDNLPVV